MNRLLETKLFILANEKLHVKENAEIKSAYDEFVIQIQSIVEKENDYIKVIRILNRTRIELIIIDSYSTSGQEKKCPKEISNESKTIDRIRIGDSIFTSKVVHINKAIRKS